MNETMNTKLFAFAALAFGMAACTNDKEGMDNGPVAAVIRAEISDAVAARASGTRWAKYDQIGISTAEGTATFYNNVCYEWDGSGFATSPENAIYFQSDETVTFHAYYPFTGMPGTAAGVLTSVSTGAENQTAENQPLIDFLYASGAEGSTRDPEVNFTDGTGAGGEDCSFHHCMSQITLTFEAGSGVDFSIVQPDSYTLSGVVLTGSFDTGSGAAKADEGAEAGNLDMPIGSTLTSSVILFPQEVKSIGLTVKFNGNNYSATLEIPEEALEAGNNYTWTVKVRNKDLSIGSAVISEWEPVNVGEVNADL